MLPIKCLLILVIIRDCNILSISSSIEEDMASLLSTEILLYVTWGEEFPFINFIVVRKRGGR